MVRVRSVRRSFLYRKFYARFFEFVYPNPSVVPGGYVYYVTYTRTRERVSKVACGFFLNFFSSGCGGWDRDVEC